MLIFVFHKLKLEIAAPEEQVEAIVEAIIASASTGKIGDGKIFLGTALF